MRDLGTPILPKRWFENLSRYAAESVRFVILRDGDETVAAGMTTSYRDCVELPCSAALQKSRKKNTAILMYWSVLSGRASRGSSVLTWGAAHMAAVRGSSSGTGIQRR